jgi:putative glycosyltransferase
MLFRSEPYVREFYRRVVAAAEQVTPSFEIVFVNDGSPDGAAAAVREILQGDARVLLVELTRNFGHHQAAVAGLRQSRGGRVFIIDVDLEEQPEWLPEFAAEMGRCGADVVFGVSGERRDRGLKRHAGALFWRLFNAISDVPVPINPCTVRLMNRDYVDALLLMPEKNIFLAGSYAWLGFHQVARVVEKKVRATRTSYTLARLFRLFVDAVTSFSAYPLRLIFFFGLALSSLAVLSGSLLIAYKLWRPQAISLGWPSLMVSVWFLGGAMIAFLGVIGIYLSKVFNETKGRPLYLVRRVVSLAADGASPPPR